MVHSVFIVAAPFAWFRRFPPGCDEMSRSPRQRCGRSYHFTLGIKFEHFEVESVPDALEVRLPFLFSMQHRHQIPASVTLFDARGNEFEVAVVRRSGDVFFQQGWRQIGRCLGLHDGGWVKMVYVSVDRFFIEVRDRLLNPPFCTGPPRVLRLHEEPRLVTQADDVLNVVDPSVYVGRRPTVVLTLYGSLSHADVSTSFLHLPSSFCDVIFPPIDCDVTLVDQSGKAWPASLIFPSCNMHTDVLLRGWRPFFEDNEFEQGYAYKLEVPVENTKLIFFGSR